MSRGPGSGSDVTSESATPPPWAWRSAFERGNEDPAEPAENFPAGFLSRGADEVAPDLLGCRLRSTVGGELTEGVIVEAEAYLGADDPASHAAARIGRTERNRHMFGPPGRAYVYFIYGMHWCVNVVTARRDDPQAVLIRALDPIQGREAMERRRGRASELCSGPARLCQALGIDGELDGHDLSRPPLRLLPGWPVDSDRIVASPRVGITAAADWPLRFHLEGHPEVSRG